MDSDLTWSLWVLISGLESQPVCVLVSAGLWQVFVISKAEMTVPFRQRCPK